MLSGVGVATAVAQAGFVPDFGSADRFRIPEAYRSEAEAALRTQTKMSLAPE